MTETVILPNNCSARFLITKMEYEVNLLISVIVCVLVHFEFRVVRLVLGPYSLKLPGFDWPLMGH